MPDRWDPARLPEPLLEFLRARHLATLTTLRADGTPHVTPVGFTYDPPRRLARVITFAGARKARNVAAAPGGPVSLCQLDGARWLTLEGTAVVSDDPQRTAEAEARYGERYRPARQRPDRVVIEVSVTRLLGHLPEHSNRPA